MRKLKRFALALALGTALAGASAFAQDEPGRASSPPLELVPFAEERASTTIELEPVLAGDTLLVASMTQIFALDAETCALRWTAGVEGWEDLEPQALRRHFTRVRFEDLHLRPTVGGGVVIAVLQLPIEPDPSELWLSEQAERRLFAFDIESGKARWGPQETASAPGMDVIAPPLVSGEHVLVACTSGEASIGYHVACHRLADGELVWKTLLVDGAVQMDMWRRPAFDFTSAPLTIARDLVIAQTNLGVIAALDVATGAVRWRTEYATIPLPKTRSYHAPRRDTVWRTSAPLVVGDVVLATPADSPALLALDLADGRLLWSRRSQDLVQLGEPMEWARFDQRIAATSDSFYLAGPKLARFTLPDGLREASDLALGWEVPLGESRVPFRAPGPRARIHDGTLHVWAAGRCRRFHADDGAELEPLALDARHGLLVTDEAVYGVGGDRVVRVAR